MTGRVFGYGKGNWGRADGRRKTYDTPFDLRLGLLLTEPPVGPKDYEPTTRGIQSALGLDPDTFNRFKNGTTEPERVVLAHMDALFFKDYEKLPRPLFWAYVKSFSIRHVYRKMEDTDEWENVFDLELNGTRVYVRKVPLVYNRKVRQILFEQFELITPPVERKEWEAIINQATSACYVGARAHDDEIAAEELSKMRRRKQDLFGFLDDGMWRPR